MKVEKSWQLFTPSPLPEGPLSPLTFPLLFQCLLTHHLSMEPFYPLLHTWQPSHEFSRATGDSWNVIPAAVPGTVVRSGKISQWYSAWLAASAEEGEICKGFGGMWPLAPPAPSSPKGRQLCVLRAWHLLPKGWKVWLYSQVLCSQKLPAEAEQKTPAQARYSFMTNSCYEETWVDGTRVNHAKAKPNQIWT